MEAGERLHAVHGAEQPLCDGPQVTFRQALGALQNLLQGTATQQPATCASVSRRVMSQQCEHMHMRSLYTQLLLNPAAHTISRLSTCPALRFVKNV